jgi:hypothetical protein
MSALGQKRTSQPIDVMSALPSKADIPRTLTNVRIVRVSDSTKRGATAGLSAVRKRFHQLADRLDEHFRDRAERPTLQGSDADWLSRIG